MHALKRNNVDVVFNFKNCEFEEIVRDLSMRAFKFSAIECVLDADSWLRHIHITQVSVMNGGWIEHWSQRNFNAANGMTDVLTKQFRHAACFYKLYYTKANERIASSSPSAFGWIMGWMVFGWYYNNSSCFYCITSAHNSHVRIPIFFLLLCVCWYWLCCRYCCWSFFFSPTWLNATKSFWHCWICMRLFWNMR